MLWSGVVARRLIAVLVPRSQHRSYTHAASSHVHTGLPEKCSLSQEISSSLRLMLYLRCYRIGSPLRSYACTSVGCNAGLSMSAQSHVPLTAYCKDFFLARTNVCGLYMILRNDEGVNSGPDNLQSEYASGLARNGQGSRPPGHGFLLTSGLYPPTANIPGQRCVSILLHSSS